jgi:hypothetical protein
VACYNPESTFIGIDSSESELTIAQNAVDTLHLKNILLIRDAILSFCGRNLTQTGLAYISYNAQPGWAMRKLVRDTLLRCKEVQDAPIAKKAAAAQIYARQLLEDLPS